MIIRHVMARWCVAVLASTGLTLASAQEFPNKPVKILIPTSTGGQPDTINRIIGDAMARVLGQPYLVENQPSAGGVGAINNLIAAPADGYLLFAGDAAHWSIGPALRPKTAIDILKNLTPVRLTHTTSIILVTHPAFPAKTVQELVAEVKANPRKYAYGSAGIGSVHHLGMEAFKAAHGLDILHVPYKSSGQALPAMIGGEIAMMFTGMSSATSFLRSNRLKPIGIVNRDRARAMPDLPTIAETTGPADFDYGSAGAVFAKAGTPQAVIDKLVDAYNRVFSMPEIAERLTKANIEFVPNTTQAKTLQFIREDIPRWANAVKVAGVKAE